MLKQIAPHTGSLRACSLRASFMLGAFVLCVAAPVAAQDVAADAHGSELLNHTWETPRPVLPPALGEIVRGGPLQTFIDAGSPPAGDGPVDVTYSVDGTKVYVVHQNSDNIAVFDAVTRQYLDTIAVGEFPTSIALAPSGYLAAVTNVFSNSVSLIDLTSNTVLAEVPITGEQPYLVRITPDGTKAVVGVINDGVASSFSVIDLATQTETLSFPSASQGVIGFWFTPETGNVGNTFTDFALTPNSQTIVLPDFGNARLALYDIASGVEREIPTQANPRAIDISPSGATAVVSHEGTTQIISKVDLTTETVTGEFFTGANLTNQVIRITRDADFALAAILNNLIFVDLTTGATTATINTGTVGDIELSFDNQYAFVSNFNARVIDLNTQTLVDTITFASCVPAAISPTELRAVAINNRFREDIHFYNINGAAGFLEGFASTGAPPEADGVVTADITPDGSLIVTGNLVSRNVSIIERASGTVRAHVDVGDRVKELRITPDGQYAVVCAMDANQVAIVDLTTDTLVSTLPIFNRPGRVRISPDGQYAYVLNVAGADNISFIRLDGANSFIESQFPAGQTGVANGPTFTETSGIELSPDGAVLAVCDSFNDLLRLYDTATQLQVAAVPTGDFPLRVQFSPDGTRAYVVNHFSDSVTAVQVDGVNSFAVGTVTGVARFPLVVEVDPSGDYVYVGTRTSGGGADAIRVIDANTLTIVATIPFGDGSPRDSKVSAAEDLLYIVTTDGRLVTCSAAGALSAIQDEYALSGGARDIAFNAALQIAAMPLPTLDGVDVFVFGTTPGDLNGDGVVDGGDLNLLLADFGLCDNDPDFDATIDLNGDGCIEGGDLNILLANWS